MKTRILALAAFVAVLRLGASALAQDEWKWDPKKKGKRTVGEKLADETKETRTFSLRRKGAKEQDKPDRFSVAYKLAREVTAVEKDRVKEARIKFEAFELQDGEAKDSSLKGRTVVVTYDLEAKHTNYKFEGGEEGITEPARDFLAALIAQEDDADELLALLLPKEPVAPDAEWKVDPEKVARKIFEGVGVDAAASSGKGKLSGVKVAEGTRHGKVEVAVEAKLKVFPGSDAPWKEGGVLKIKVTIDGVLDDAAPGTQVSKSSLELKGKAETESAEGEKVEVEMEMGASQESTETLTREKK